MKRALLVLLLAMAGCATTEPRPAAVRVPVTVPCRAPDIATPRFATADLHPADDLQTKVRALLAERRQHLAYETRLRAALDACR